MSTKVPSLVFWLLLLLISGGGLYWWHVHDSGSVAAGPDGGRHGMAAGPMPVQAQAVSRGDLHVFVDGIGTVTAFNSAVVRSRVSGEVVRLDFHEGDSVRAGQTLALVDPRPYQVALSQAEGQLARDQALLAGARVDQKRYQGLLAQDSIAAQQVDSQNALVRQYEGAVRVDQGAVASARLNLAYTQVTTSAAGIAGLRQVDVGNVVTPSDSNGLVVVNQVQPIYVVFAVPEDDVPELLRNRQQGQAMLVEAWDRDDRTRLATGRVASVDNQIDTATGTLKLRAVFANADRSLFPNQFVNAHLLLETRHNVLLAPAAAVQRGNQGSFVFVVGSGQQVAMRPVSTGPLDGDKVQVLSGLNEGEIVVIDGADKLKDGGKVSVVATPAAALAPSGQRHHPSDTAQ